MKGQETLFSSKSNNWATPKNLYDEYMSMGAFDPCPLNASSDGLAMEWETLTYVNLPYSEIRKWMEKALSEIALGNTALAIFLVPARVDTKWFQELVYGLHAHKFLKGRLKFGDSKNSAPFPSMVIYFT